MNISLSKVSVWTPLLDPEYSVPGACRPVLRLNRNNYNQLCNLMSTVTYPLITTKCAVYNCSDRLAQVKQEWNRAQFAGTNPISSESNAMLVCAPDLSPKISTSKKSDPFEETDVIFFRPCLFCPRPEVLDVQKTSRLRCETHGRPKNFAKSSILPRKCRLSNIT